MDLQVSWKILLVLRNNSSTIDKGCRVTDSKFTVRRLDCLRFVFQKLFIKHCILHISPKNFWIFSELCWDICIISSWSILDVTARENKTNQNPLHLLPRGETSEASTRRWIIPRGAGSALLWNMQGENKKKGRGCSSWPDHITHNAVWAKLAAPSPGGACERGNVSGFSLSGSWTENCLTGKVRREPAHRDRAEK